MPEKLSGNALAHLEGMEVDGLTKLPASCGEKRLRYFTTLAEKEEHVQKRITELLMCPQEKLDLIFLSFLIHKVCLSNHQRSLCSQ